MMRAPPIFLLLVACACGNGRDRTEQQPRPVDRDRLLEDNKRYARLERQDIDAYVMRHGLEMEDTGTGTRVKLLRDMEGATARPGQMATVNYRMELLDGTLCYASEPGRPESFRIEMDDVESGLHEAVQHMSPGDSAIVVIPSHRAHGLIGDMNRVPGRSTVVYRIGLVALGE
jgi:FKBP-type peptidyl-prolyl cis-trans isomerase